MITYQDFYGSNDIEKMILLAIQDHKADSDYKIAVDAELYDRQLNPPIMAYQKFLRDINGKSVPDNYSANHKMASNFFNLFVTQLNQYLLGNGVTMDKKERLGYDFDTQFQFLGRTALVQKVGFGFWNFDHLEYFKFTEFVPLYDEETGTLKAGIRYWQLDNNVNRPLRVTLYELDGVTEYIQRKGEELTPITPKRTYKQIIRTSVADGTRIDNGGNYPNFPIIPFWGNPLHQSELVGIKNQIDAYDLIKSGFANDLDDNTQIYWILKNCGGMTEIDAKEFLDTVNRIHVAMLPNADDGATAERTMQEIPVQARLTYLEKLEQDLYRFAQAFDVRNLSGGQKTATEINAAYQPLDSKADQYEYCARNFLTRLFEIVGIDKNEPVSFTRSKITNQMEQTQMILMARDILGERKTLEKLPFVNPEEIEEIMQDKETIDMQRFGIIGAQDNENNIQTE